MLDGNRTYRSTGLCSDGVARQSEESERQESRHLSGWVGAVGSRRQEVMGRSVCGSCGWDGRGVNLLEVDSRGGRLVRLLCFHTVWHHICVVDIQCDSYRSMQCLY